MHTLMQYLGFVGSSSHPYSSPQLSNESEDDDDDEESDHIG